MSPTDHLVSRRLSLMASLMMLFIGVVPGAWAQQSRIGVVDLAALLMFHPTMASYDPFSKTFARGKPEGVVRNAAVAQEATTRRAGEAKARASELRNQLRLVDGRLMECRQRYDRMAQESEQEYRQRIANVTKTRALQEQSLFQSQRTVQDQKRAAELRGFEIERERLTEGIAQLESYGAAGTLMGPTETNQTFLAMLTEIRRVTAQIAARRGIDVVFDASSAGIRQVVNEEPSAGLSGNPLAQVLNPSVPATIARDAPAMKGMFAMQSDLATLWYRNRAFVLGPFRQHLFNSFIVSGGVDLTQEVMVTLMTEHGVSHNAQGLLIQAWRSGL